MADLGTQYTDKELAKLEKKINAVYAQAQLEIQAKMDVFKQNSKAKGASLMEQVRNGDVAWDDYVNWLKGQAFQNKQWKDKVDQVTNILADTNGEALRLINGKTIDVFAFNSNFQSYSLEYQKGLDFGFGLVNAETVSYLIKDEPHLLPNKQLNRAKDEVWNRKKISQQVTQGILQGEKLDQIADRIASVAGTDRKAMLTNARTAMTGAQNAGRYYSLQRASFMGINVEKEWMATLDSTTRDTHRSIDGETINVGDKWHPERFSNGCRYPGDPTGPPAEVYNCRCTLVGNVLDYPNDKYQRRDNEDRKPIDNMTYREWEQYKKKTAPFTTPTPPSAVPSTTKWIDMCKANPTPQEMLNKENAIFGDMTAEQRDSLQMYTGSAYESMNGYLRYVGAGMSHDDAVMKSRISKSQLNAIGPCHDALNNHRLSEDMVFRRGSDVGDLAGLFMKGDFDTNRNSLEWKTADELNSMFKGSVGKYFGFTSTSSQWDRGFDDNVELIVYAPKGTAATSIMSISNFGTDEGETLFRDGTTVVCEGIEESDGHMNSSIRVFLRVIVD